LPDYPGRTSLITGKRKRAKAALPTDQRGEGDRGCQQKDKTNGAENRDQ